MSFMHDQRELHDMRGHRELVRLKNTMADDVPALLRYEKGSHASFVCRDDLSTELVFVDFLRARRKEPRRLRHDAFCQSENGGIVDGRPANRARAHTPRQRSSTRASTCFTRASTPPVTTSTSVSKPRARSTISS